MQEGSNSNSSIIHEITFRELPPCLQSPEPTSTKPSPPKVTTMIPRRARIVSSKIKSSKSIVVSTKPTLDPLSPPRPAKAEKQLPAGRTNSRNIATRIRQSSVLIRRTGSQTSKGLIERTQNQQEALSFNIFEDDYDEWKLKQVQEASRPASPNINFKVSVGSISTGLTNLDSNKSIQIPGLSIKKPLGFVIASKESRGPFRLMTQSSLITRSNSWLHQDSSSPPVSRFELRPAPEIGVATHPSPSLIIPSLKTLKSDVISKPGADIRIIHFKRNSDLRKSVLSD